MDGRTFRNAEKERYEGLKSKLFSENAQRNGTYRGRVRDFYLSNDLSEENLYESIRQPAIQYFNDRHIPWHDGLLRRTVPSNHLCCSQTCCINFLFPMATDPDLLGNVFRSLYPDLKEALPINEDLPRSDRSFPYMAFEWIGSRDTEGKYIDYLTEHKNKKGSPTRGANYTSADFVFRFRTIRGTIHVVLGEWKYTEYYGSTDFGDMTTQGKKAEVRKTTYRPAYSKEGGAFEGYADLYEALFYEPFYQLMRQQLLAQEMQAGREMEADVVSVLHISPKANVEFRSRVTSPRLAERYPGKGALDIWEALMPNTCFLSVSAESMLDAISNCARDENSGWADYLKLRYSWNRGDQK